MGALAVTPDDHGAAVAADLGYLPQEGIVAAISKTCWPEGQAWAGLNIGALQRLHTAAHAAVIRSHQAPPATETEKAPPKQKGNRRSSPPTSTDEGAFRIFPMHRVAEFRNIHVKVTGDLPLASARATADQISALFATVSSWRAPFVDFAVLGPYGDRIMRTLQGDIFVGSELVKKQVKGGVTYEAWLRCWSIFKAASILLGIASPASLDG